MSSLKIYVKNNQEVKVSPKFVYCSSVYKIWNQGAGLLDETYYVSSKPLNLKKIPTKLKQKGYTVLVYWSFVKSNTKKKQFNTMFILRRL